MKPEPARVWKSRALAWGLLLTVAVATTGQAQSSAELARPDAYRYYRRPGPELGGPEPQNGPGPAASPSSAPSDEALPGPVIEKVRKLSRSFPVTTARLYSLDTRYGRVQVNTWSRPEIRTDVEVITRAENEEKAQQLQEMIQVQLFGPDAVTGGGISARSVFGSMPRECRAHTKLYEVNYTVWLPKNTPLRVYNTFGDISITGDLTGSTELAVEYGSLRTGRLEGSQNLLRVGNGQAAVSYARKASIDASYSRLRLDAGLTVDLRNNYSDVDIGTVQDLTVHSKYGDVALGTVSSLRGSSGYSRFSIDKIDDQMNMTVQYCPSFEVRNAGRNFRTINVAGGYSTILLNFADDIGFTFDVNTQHGKLVMDKRLVKVESEESNTSSSDTQGTFGVVPARNPGSVTIKLQHGDVRFNH